MPLLCKHPSDHDTETVCLPYQWSASSVESIFKITGEVDIDRAMVLLDKQMVARGSSSNLTLFKILSLILSILKLTPILKVRDTQVNWWQAVCNHCKDRIKTTNWREVQCQKPLEIRILKICKLPFKHGKRQSFPNIAWNQFLAEKLFMYFSFLFTNIYIFHFFWRLKGSKTTWITPHEREFRSRTDIS